VCRRQQKGEGASAARRTLLECMQEEKEQQAQSAAKLWRAAPLASGHARHHCRPHASRISKRCLLLHCLRTFLPRHLQCRGGEGREGGGGLSRSAVPFFLVIHRWQDEAAARLVTLQREQEKASPEENKLCRRLRADFRDQHKPSEP